MLEEATRGAAESDDRRLAGLLAGRPEHLAEVRTWVRGAASPFRASLAAEMEDLEQEVAIELIEALRAGAFEGRSRLATYVRRMTLYKCLNRLRASRRRPVVDVTEIDLPDGRPSTLERLEQTADLELALRVLARMPEHCRRLWSMILSGVGYAAMSEALGLAPGTLRVRVLRCREKAVAMRRRLETRNASESAGTEDETR